MGIKLLNHTHVGVRPSRHLGLKRDPFPDNLGPHIGGKLWGSRPPGSHPPLVRPLHTKRQKPFTASTISFWHNCVETRLTFFWDKTHREFCAQM